MAESYTEIFLLRVWAEPRELARQPSVYRAYVEHVGSGHTRYAATLGQVVDFVCERLNDSELPRGGFLDDLGS